MVTPVGGRGGFDIRVPQDRTCTIVQEPLFFNFFGLLSTPESFSLPNICFDNKHKSPISVAVASLWYQVGMHMIPAGVIHAGCLTITPILLEAQTFFTEINHKLLRNYVLLEHRSHRMWLQFGKQRIKGNATWA